MLVSCSARPRCQATSSASADASPNARTESRPDRGRDPVAVEVERGQVGRDDRGRGVHLHAVDHGQEILLAQAVTTGRREQHAGDRVARLARRRAPRPGRAMPPSPASLSAHRRRLVGHVVHQAAERVDRVHRGPAVAREHLHAAVERGAGAADQTLDLAQVGAGGAERGHAAHRSAETSDPATSVFCSLTRVATGSPPAQPARQPAGQADDDGHFEPQPAVARAAGQVLGGRVQRVAHGRAAG